jgi:uncharacterized membrane protein YphA (DoxX/SURF4 family)
MEATSATTSTRAPGRGLRIALWTCQVLLAIAFALSGAMKLGPLPAEALQAKGAVVLSEGLIRFIGVVELLGAVGVVVPALLRVKPWLTPLASAGLAVVMVLAVAFHVVNGEAAHTPAPLALGAIAVFVSWGRFRKAPVAPR